MPEIRLQRARATLPEGYQFGDGKWTPEQVIARDQRDAILDRLDVDAYERGLVPSFAPPLGCRIESA